MSRAYGLPEEGSDPHPESGEGTLDARTAALVSLSAELGAGLDAELAPRLRQAAERAGPREVEETLLQAHLFVGFPPVLEAFRAWRRFVPPPGEGTDALPAEGEGGAPLREAWRRRGVRVCGRVYGSSYEKLRDNVARLHPDLDRWMVEDGYGKVLGRPGLDLRTRELCIVALLAVGAGRPQLHSHLRGALRVGARPAEVEAALEAGLARAGSGERNEVVRALWRRLRSGGAARETAPGPADATSHGGSARSGGSGGGS